MAKERAKVNPSNYVTAEVTFSYVKLFTPQPDDEGKLKYSVCILLDKKNKGEMLRWGDAVEAAIQIGITKGMFTANQRSILKLPIRDGDEELATEVKKGLEYKGRVFVNANTPHEKKDGSINPPPSITKPLNGVAVPITDPLEFFSGCTGRAIISFFPYKSPKGARGVAVAINGAYKTGEGPRLDGRVDAVSVFSKFAEEDSPEETEGGEFE